MLSIRYSGSTFLIDPNNKCNKFGMQGGSRVMTCSRLGIDREGEILYHPVRR